MARALWTGSLSSGLVNVPVSVVPAVGDLDLHFHQLHRPDGAPIEVKRWCSKGDIEVRHREGALTLTTMRFADEIRDTKDVDTATQKSDKPTRKQLEAAIAVIEALATSWEPEKHTDRYRAPSSAGRRPQAEGPEDQSTTETQERWDQPDLMAGLEHTVEQLKSDS